MIKKPKEADPNRAIHTALLNPLKGFLDSCKSLDLKLGSKFDARLLGLFTSNSKMIF